MAHQTWLATLNNPDVEHQEYLEGYHTKHGADYVVGQLEKGSEGTVHLQFFVHFPKANKKRLAAMKKLDQRVHWEPVRVNNGADNYCMKEETRMEGPWEFGVRPVKRNSKTDWDRVFEEAKAGNFDAIPAPIRVKHYGNLVKIAKDHITPSDSADVRGTWIYGEAGIGKSRKAREDFPDFYPKLCNKWWDGYLGQKNVIMDDIGLEHKVLGQQLKIWGDRYGCVLETKGGALGSAFDNFVVTSQYSIEDIWSEDPKTVAALKRRFKQIHMI